MSTRMIGQHAHLWQEPDPDRAAAVAGEAFHRDGIVCIKIADMDARCGYLAAKHLRLLGEQYFGKRKG